MFRSLLAFAAVSIGATIAAHMEVEGGRVGSRAVPWSPQTELRHAADMWFIKQADLMRSLFQTFPGHAALCSHLDAFVSDISSRTDLQGRHVQMIAQVFEYVRREYLSGKIPMGEHMLPALLVSELDFHVGLGNWIWSVPNIAELFEVTRLRNRALSTMDTMRQDHLTSFETRAVWLRNLYRVVDQTELATFRESLEVVLEAAEALTLEHGVDVRESYLPLSILRIYEPANFEFSTSKSREYRMEQLVSYIGNEAVESLALIWGRVLSDPRHRLINSSSNALYAIAPQLIGICIEKSHDACDVLRILWPYIATLLDRSRALAVHAERIAGNTYLDILNDLTKFIENPLTHVPYVSIELMKSSVQHLKDLPRDMIVLHADASVLLALLPRESAADIRLIKLMGQILGPEPDDEVRHLFFAIAKSVIATPRTEIDNVWIDRIFARYVGHRNTETLLFELAKWAGVEPLKLFSSEISMGGINVERYREVISSLAVASDLSNYCALVSHEDTNDFGLYKIIWNNVFSSAIGQVTGSAEPVDGLVDFLFQLTRDIQNFQMNSQWSAIAGSLPEVVLRYPSNALIHQIRLSGNWNPNAPGHEMMVNVYNPYPVVIQQLTQKVEDVYKESIGRALSLAQARSLELKQSRFIQALMGLPRTTLFAMAGPESMMYMGPLLEAAESYMNLFLALPGNRYSADLRCLDILVYALNQYSETTTHIANGTPISVKSLERISRTFNKIAESRWADCNPAENVL